MRNLDSQGYIPHPTLQPQVEKDGKERSRIYPPFLTVNPES